MTSTPTAPPAVLIGYDTTGYPLLPPVPPPPRVIQPAGGSGNRRARRGIRSVLGAAVMLLVAATAVQCSGIGPTESPESLVRAVFAALTAHDGQRLRDLGWCDHSPLCTADGLTTGYQAPERFEIVPGGRGGKDHRVVKIRYVVGGIPAEETVGLTRYRAGLLGHRWGITELPGARLDLRTAASDQLHLAGAVVAPNPVAEPAGVTLPQPYAPPGVYTVALDADTLFAATEVKVVVAGGVDPPPTVVTPALRPELLAQIEQQVRDRISYCAGQAEFHPYTPQWRTFTETCPFQHDPLTPFTTPPTWTVQRMPKIALNVDEHAGISVRTTSAGTVTVRYQWSVDVLEPRRWTDASKTIEFTIGGKVGVKDNAPAWIG